MERRTNGLIAAQGFVLGSIVVLGSISVAWLLHSRLQTSATDCTLEWGRLAPLPKSAQQIAIVTEGSMFTREFRTSFFAAPEDIEEWLQSSPGTREGALTTPSPGIRHFQIKAGGGAEFAEVIVDDSLHRVFIHVYWS
jgi:hypothetical protein